MPTRRVAENISWGAEPCHPIPLLLPPRAAASSGGGGGGGASGGGADGAGAAIGAEEAGEEAGAEMGGEMGEVPFMFVAGVNIGPLLVRRAAYLQAGGFDEAFSPRSHVDLT